MTKPADPTVVSDTPECAHKFDNNGHCEICLVYSAEHDNYGLNVVSDTQGEPVWAGCSNCKFGSWHYCARPAASSEGCTDAPIPDQTLATNMRKTLAVLCDVVDGWQSKCAELESSLSRAVMERDQLRVERDQARDALMRLRDCDWVISLPDRMDTVREIARAALAPLSR